jgi:serine/threonine protein kinase
MTITGKIGRYEIKSELGRGGMAVVVLAYDPNVKRDVAIKVLPVNFTHEPTFRSRFEREAQTIAALEYPGVVPVYDFGEEQGQPYLVMRYMPGGSLSDKLKNGPLSLVDSSRIFSRLGVALDHVHSKGIIHRDLKPANILFDMYDNAYLSDFGIARIAEAGLEHTGEGMIGTPAYMSPEQARGDADIDGRSDIYALGAILFEMLTGRQPFESTTPMGVAVKHLTDPIPRLLNANSNAPIECQDVIDKAMAKDPKQRYQTAASMAQALAVIASRTKKNPVSLGDERTERITPVKPVRVHPSQIPPVSQAPVQRPAPIQPGTPPPPVFTPPPPASGISAGQIQSIPPRTPPPQPPYPSDAVSAQPGYTPAPPPASSAVEAKPAAPSGPALWMWLLLGAIGLSAICGVVLLVIWLASSGR